jgi:Xaa-Pro aminopeptidase
MSTLLFFDSPRKSADLRYAVPVDVLDPFLYAEQGDRRTAVLWKADAGRVAEGGVEIIDPVDAGRDEFLAQGLLGWQVELETSVRAVELLGITRATVPFEFPVALADRLREAGVELEVDPEVFIERRRRKRPEQIEGHRRASKVASLAMARAAELIHGCREGLTAEAVRADLQQLCDKHGCDLGDDVLIAPGPQGAVGHIPGSGPINPGDPVIVDLWPMDRASHCWSDMTRTFAAGRAEMHPDIVKWHTLAVESLQRVLADVKAGVACSELHATSCAPFEAAGEITQLNKPEGASLDYGYWWALGHGVGLEVHEAPYVGRSPDVLVAGDVIALEPGSCRLDLGSGRVEDLVLVTEDGYEQLTDFPYDL